MKRKHFVASAFWYGLSGGVPSFITPFLPLFYSSPPLNFTPSQIGLLSALRPWISAPCGSVAAAAADRLGSHRAVLLFCFIVAIALQGAMALALTFPAQLALTIAVSTVWTGASIIGDAAVMAASDPGDYGRLRTWASAAWVAVAPVAGWVNERFGVRMGIAAYVLGSLIAIPAAWSLPLDVLRPHVPEEEEAKEARRRLEEPLLAEEGPVVEAGAERPRLARALAIVKYIEAITEIGAVPPPGALYGFAEVATPYAAGHLRHNEDRFFEEPMRAIEEEKETAFQGADSVQIEPMSPFESLSNGGGEIAGNRFDREELHAEEDQSTMVRAPTIARTIPQRTSLPLARRHIGDEDTEIPESEAVHADLHGVGSSSDDEVFETAMEGTDEVAGTAGGPSSPSQPGQASEVALPPTSLRLRVGPLMPAVSATDLLKDLRGMKMEGARLEEEQALSADGAPQRLTAIQRLAQFFGFAENNEGSSLPKTTITEESLPSSPPVQQSSFSMPSLLTPVQRYLESRQKHLMGKTERRRARAAARNAPFEDEPPTPPGDAFVIGGEFPTELTDRISPDEMREALELEAEEVSGVDPTGSLVVAMLSKKLARLAREEERARRERRRRTRATEEGGVRVLTHPQAPIDTFHGEESRGPSDQHQDSLARLITDPGILAFFSLAILLGFGHGIIGVFLFLYLKILGAGETLMGLVLIANALPELPVFYFFGSILRAVGMDTLLLTSTGALAVRLGLYPALRGRPLWMVLPLETLHAITFACGWSACAINASKIAPNGLESTSQALFQGLWTGVGAGIGGLLGGVLYHWRGPEWVFVASGALIGLGTLVAGLVLGARHRHQRRMRTSSSLTLVGNEATQK